MKKFVALLCCFLLCFSCVFALSACKQQTPTEYKFEDYFVVHISNDNAAIGNPTQADVLASWPPNRYNKQYRFNYESLKTLAPVKITKITFKAMPNTLSGPFNFDLSLVQDYTITDTSICKTYQANEVVYFTNAYLNLYNLKIEFQPL